MQKFFSFLCALTIILSANAAPRFTTAQKASFTKIQKVEKKAAIAKVRTDDAAAKFQKVADAKQTVANRAKAKKAIKAATDVTVSAIFFKFYEEDGDAYYELYNEDASIGFAFDILVAEGDEDVELGKVYTIDDMLADYCLWYETADPYDGDYAQFTACQFLKTQGADGKIRIEATATDENGAEWKLLYDEATAPQAPEGGTFVADQAIGTYYPSYGDIQYIMTFTEAKLKFSFDILLPEGEEDVVSGQEYTLDEMDADYTWGVFNSTTEIDIASAFFTKTVEEDGSFTIAVVVIDGEGNTWNLSYAQGAPTIGEETLTLNGFVELGTSLSQIEAANEDSTILVSLLVYSSDLEGDFTIDDLLTIWSLSFVLFDGVEYDITDAAFSVTFDAEKNEYTCTGTLNCENPDDATDLKIFTLNLTLAGPEPIVPDREENFVMSGARLITFEDGFQLVGDEETRYISIAAFSDVVAGEYTASDLEADYTYIGFFNNNDTVWYDLADADITIEVNGETVTITGDFLGTEYVLEGGENVLFHLNITATLEEYVDPAEGIENVTNDKSQMTNKVIKDGQLYIIRDNKVFNAIGTRVR